MSIKRGGGNIETVRRIYEKDYLLEFHKGFVLTKLQFDEVSGHLDKFDFDAVGTFLNKNFGSDANIVASMLEHQKKLKTKGYYARKAKK